MRESRSFYARWSRRKRESKTDSDVHDNSASTERDVDEEPAVPALTDADMPALETLHDDSDYSGFLSPEVSDKSREVTRRKIFHGKVFNIVDGLDDDALLESVKRSPTSSGMMTPSDILADD